MKKFRLKLIFYFLGLFIVNVSFAQGDSLEYVYEDEELWVGDVNTEFYTSVKDTIEIIKQQDAYKYMSNAERIYRQMKEGVEKEDTKTDKTADNLDVSLNWKEIGWFKYILWSLLIGLVVSILWNVVFGHLNLFKRNKSIKAVSDADVFYNEKNVDGYQKLISEAKANGKNRLAVRYSFLYVLSILNENGLIKLSKEKTNKQYLAEFDIKEMKPALKRLISIYDYVWFGEFEFDEVKFTSFFSEFDLFISKVKNNGI